MEKIYLRKDTTGFGFVASDIHDILPTDIEVSTEEYKSFFEAQASGKEFKLKEIPTGNKLFDYLEEFVSEQPERIGQPGVEEHLLDLEFRVSILELGGM